MKYHALSYIAAMLFASGAHAADKIVIYGDDDYPPYSYVEGTHFKGIYVDILKQAIERLPSNYQVELQPMPWKRGMAEIEKGAIFALFPPWFRADRTYIQYSTPILREEVVVFCNEDVLKTPRKKVPDDFTGLTIGINTGFGISPALSAASKSGSLVLSEAKGTESNLRKLASKRVDCYANDRASILHTAKQLRTDPTFAGFKLIEATHLSSDDGHIGYSVHFKAAYKADFIEKMNAAIEAVKKANIVPKIVDNYTK